MAAICNGKFQAISGRKTQLNGLVSQDVSELMLGIDFLVGIWQLSMWSISRPYALETVGICFDRGPTNDNGADDVFCRTTLSYTNYSDASVSDAVLLVSHHQILKTMPSLDKTCISDKLVLHLYW